MSTCRNKEGYWDRVAGQAIREVEKEERRTGNTGRKCRYGKAERGVKRSVRKN